MNAVKRFLLLAVLLVSCTVEYPQVTVVNASAGPLTGIVLTLDDGNVYSVGSLGANEETTVVVEPRWESDVTIIYTDDSGVTRTVSGGYIEKAGAYHLTLTVRAEGVVDFDVNFD